MNRSLSPALYWYVVAIKEARGSFDFPFRAENHAFESQLLIPFRDLCTVMVIGLDQLPLTWFLGHMAG